ncbi:hypothetical protein [Fimbriiglobus ruber]|uniref:Peptidase C39-like domain-containing protein n=1 Tax=Fimbriiglobus ruber TaxID=1908690 RepID=A0A225D2P6_9BACT|nr:hypothetical protein [Fimbriiglobus ruber]OWK35792.1 hypothetical protein FRUB_08355 [Fimbriiglobus ruber]
MPPRSSVPTFAATTHGFPFPNCYPPGSPVISVPTPFGQVKVGDASGGLCGGMVFAALDLFLFGLPRPTTPHPPVYQYFCRRLLDSWNLPFGVMKYYDWQCRPGASRTLAGVRIRDGVSRLTIEEEWPKVRAAIDAGTPAPLGLVKPNSFSPRTLGQNHQVLAYGYELDGAGQELTLLVYDPNYPNDDHLTLRVSLADPDRERQVVHSVEGPSVRGFFLTEYRCPPDAPVF